MANDLATGRRGWKSTFAISPVLAWMLFICTGLSLGAQAQQRAAAPLFQEDNAARVAAQTSPLAALLYQSRPFSLGLSTVRATLAAASPETQPGGTPVVLALPLPDGRTGRFAVYEAPVMAPALAARHPNIKTYAGRGLDDPTATARLDVMPGGFHAQVLSATAGPVYIDPVSPTDTEHYLSFRAADSRPRATPATCASVAGPAAASMPQARSGGSSNSTQNRQIPVGNVLRTYRLAVSTTDEYTATYGGPAAALEGVIRSVNRVVGVYERELAVRLELVPNEDALIADGSSSTPDAFSNNNTSTTALVENQTFINQVIGVDNYDLGHVFGTLSSSYALIGVLCTSTKARGESGFPVPAGDTFDIRVVAHEMGHQLGANHSFNSSTMGNCAGAGNRVATAAYEPGSGSTLMSYAGLCGSDDIIPAADAYFHTSSYQVIQAIISNANCATQRVTGNTPPSVTAPASGKTLPISTPFKLTASATDADNDALTYCWEQMDRGATDSPSSAQVAGQTPPLFRSRPGDSSPTRYFPALADLLANTPNSSERLPTVTRPLTFVCTVRDAHNGPLGVIGGVAQTTDLTLSATAAAGPFLVTAPNTALTWASGSTQTVTWDVAGTTANGVNCAAVNLRLSTDGGLTYPVVLLANTPNDGSQAITVPNVATSTARLMVEAADNYFFDISNANFTIAASASAPALSSLNPSSGIIGSTVMVSGSNLAGTTSVTFNGISASFSGLTATGFTVAVPAGATTGPVVVSAASGSSNALNFTVLPAISSFTPASGTVGTRVTITGSNLAAAATVSFNGTAALDFSSNAAGTQLTATVPAGASTGLISMATPDGTATSATSFTVLPTPCAPPTGLSFRQITSTGAVLLFAPSAGGQSYTVTTSPASTTQTVTTGYVTLSSLTGSTTYTVSIVSNCAGGQTATLTFSTAPTTLNNECATAVTLTPGAPGADCTPTGGTVAGATQSQAPVTCSGSRASTARDVWYSFTATNATHTVSVTSAFNGVLEVLTGACGSLTSLNCSDNFTTSGNETLTLINLSVGTTYLARYYPTQSTTVANPFITICVTTPVTGCQAPTNVVTSAPSISTVHLDFTRSPSAGSYTITTVPASSTVTTTLTSLNLVNLTHTTNYTVNVVSNCSGGAVSAPASATFTTDTPPPCIAPTNLVVSSLTATSVTIGYTSNSVYDYFLVTTVPATATYSLSGPSLQLGNLTPGTQYTANLALQCGAAGTVSTFITFTTLPPPCSPASNLSISNITSTSAQLNFTPHATANSYTVSTSPGSTTQTITGNSALLSGLNPGTVYSVLIRSNCNSGAASATISFTTTPPDLVVSTTYSIPAITYRNITVTSTGDASLSGDIAVEGVLRVQAGGRLRQTCSDISGPGSFVLEDGATLTICHPQGITTSGPTGGIQLTGSRSFSPEASYTYVNSSAQVTGNGLPSRVFSLEAQVNTGLSLTNSVAITRQLLLNSDLLLGNSNLVLLSNARGTAFVVQQSGARVLLNGNGRATMQRYIEPSTGYTGPGYRHYSSPMTSARVSGLTLPGYFAPLLNPAYNALPTPILPLAQFPTIFGYNQNRLTAAYPSFSTGWYSPVGLNDTLRASRGYTVNLRPTDTLSLSGNFNTGFISTGPLLRGVGPDAGWHLLGNPYPAPLDWHRVETTPGGIPTGLSGAIYVFEPNAHYSGFYRSFANNIGTLGFDGMVPAMQGFFVRATQNIPAGFLFQNDFRLTTYRNPTFHRQVNTAADGAGRPLLRLQLSSLTTPSAGPDETVVYLESGATVGPDARFDAAKVPNPGAVVSLASQMPGAGNEALAINGLPLLAAGSPAVRVPLQLAVPAAGTYQLNAVSITDFDPTLPILLLDHATGLTTDLRQQPLYSFLLSQGGTLSSRFELWLGRPAGPLATAAAAGSEFSVWPNPVRSKAALHLALETPASAATATLRNVLGQVVARTSFSGSATTLPTDGLAPGTYLLTVRVGEQVAVTRRVLVE